jgi:AcrR family transcriptional regulator
MTVDPPIRRGRGRRPAPEVRAGVLAAAGRILLRDGLAAVTFDRVAAEAGSSRMTLYKWWPSPGALAAEAYFTESEAALSFHDTGDIRADLIAQLEAFVRWLLDDGAAAPVSQLIGAAQADPDVARAWAQEYARPRRDLACDRLRAAQRDGQISPDADVEIVVDQLWGAVYHRLLVLKTPFDVALVARIVDQALRGIGVSTPLEGEDRHVAPRPGLE